MIVTSFLFSIHGIEKAEPIDPLDFIRTIATARIMMPGSVVRLSAGREEMSEEMQAMCFFAGANSLFIGDELLTTANPTQEKDEKLFAKLGLKPMAPASDQAKPQAAE